MAEQPFYSIYDKLITGKDDVIGMLAYSIYKQHKIELRRENVLRIATSNISLCRLLPPAN